MGPTDPRGHFILSDGVVDMLAMTLSVKRKHTNEGDLLNDKRDVQEVLEVMRASDMMAISQGSIENLLTQIRNFLMDLAGGNATG